MFSMNKAKHFILLSISSLLFGVACLNEVKNQSADPTTTSDAKVTLTTNASSSNYTNPTSTTVDRVTKVVSGYNHSCAITSTGKLKCWGDNTYGQLGSGDTITQFKPILVQGSGVTNVAAGGDTTCAVFTGGTLKCWGRNDFGQTGKKAQTGYSEECGTGTAIKFCTKLPNTVIAKDVTMVGVGDAHVCAGTATTLRCWGDNTYGQLGIDYDAIKNGTNTHDSTEIPQALYKAEFTDCTRYIRSCNIGGLLDSVCFNYICDVTNSPNPYQSQPAFIIKPIQISVGSRHTCALFEANFNITVSLLNWQTITPYMAYGCWGDNSSKQIVFDDNYVQLTNNTAPAKMYYPYLSIHYPDDTTKSSVKIISAGGYVDQSTHTAYTCFLKFVPGSTPNNKVFCYGNNSKSQLGIINPPSILDGSNPLNVPPLLGAISAKNILNVFVGPNHSCSYDNSLYPYCWGNNDHGQSGGTASATPVSSPQVIQPTTMKVFSIGIGLNHTCLIETGYNLKCFGDNSKGQLGVGNSTSWPPNGNVIGAPIDQAPDSNPVTINM